jgi:hypothetical protein
MCMGVNVGALLTSGGWSRPSDEGGTGRGQRESNTRRRQPDPDLTATAICCTPRPDHFSQGRPPPPRDAPSQPSDSPAQDSSRSGQWSARHCILIRWRQLALSTLGHPGTPSMVRTTRRHSRQRERRACQQEGAGLQAQRYEASASGPDSLPEAPVRMAHARTGPPRRGVPAACPRGQTRN